MIFRVLLLFVFCSQNYICQNLDLNYQCLENYNPTKKYIDKLCNGYDSLFSKLDFSKKSESKLFSESFNEIKKSIKSISNDSLLMHNDIVTNYLQSLVCSIQKNNPAIFNRKFNLLTYRTSIPNASSYGNGLILYNLDLITKLNNEAEVAFILCHEMSHDVKGHFLESIKKSYELKMDPKIKKDFENVKNKKFNQLQSYENYLTKYIQSITSKKRENEVQADSLGLVYFVNAGYNPQDAYNTMDRLDSIDNQFYKDKIDYEKIFNSLNFSFNMNWLNQEQQEETISGGNFNSKEKPDSLKTHPDCKLRLNSMKKLGLKNEFNTEIKNDFLEIKKVVDFEMLRVFLDEKDLSNGIYNNLHLINKYPSNKYLKVILIEFLYEIYIAKTSHYVSKTVDEIDPFFNSSYIETICFINNINKVDLNNLIKNYFTTNFTSNITDPYVGYVFTLVKSIDQSSDKKEELLKNYGVNFGENFIYYSKLKYKFLKK
jgi:hypothetical protein